MSLSILYMVGAFTFGRFSFQPVLKIRSKSEPLSNSLDKNANKSKVKEKNIHTNCNEYAVQLGQFEVILLLVK